MSPSTSCLHPIHRNRALIPYNLCEVFLDVWSNSLNESSLQLLKKMYGRCEKVKRSTQRFKEYGCLTPPWDRATGRHLLRVGPRNKKAANPCGSTAVLVAIQLPSVDAQSAKRLNGGDANKFVTQVRGGLEEVALQESVYRLGAHSQYGCGLPDRQEQGFKRCCFVLIHTSFVLPVPLLSCLTEAARRRVQLLHRN